MLMTYSSVRSHRLTLFTRLSFCVFIKSNVFLNFILDGEEEGHTLCNFYLLLLTVTVVANFVVPDGLLLVLLFRRAILFLLSA